MNSEVFHGRVKKDKYFVCETNEFLVKVLGRSNGKRELFGRIRTDSDEFRWIQTGSDGFRRTRMGFGWIQMGLDGFGWDSDGFGREGEKRGKRKEGGIRM